MKLIFQLSRRYKASLLQSPIATCTEIYRLYGLIFTGSSKALRHEQSHEVMTILIKNTRTEKPTIEGKVTDALQTSA